MLPTRQATEPSHLPVAVAVAVQAVSCAVSEYLQCIKVYNMQALGDSAIILY